MPAKLVENDMKALDAQRCVSLTNKMTGFKFNRPEPKNDVGWYLLYENCKINANDWVFEYDAELPSSNPADFKYNRGDLEGYSVPKLRKIGLELGVSGDGKPDLIENILKAQG